MTARDTSDLTITRTIRAPRQKVFDAFVKPEIVRRWFGARGFTITQADIDSRVGGRYRMTMQPRTGEPYTVVGEYREITSPERVSFTWKWEGESMGALPETLVTVTLSERRAEHGVETEVKLLHSGFPAAPIRDAHVQGWNSTLNRLVDATDSRGTAATLQVIGTPRSSYVRSVRMALAEKGLAYTFDHAAPHSDDVTAICPFGRVPAFRDGDLALYETSAIIRYLDESFGAASLIAGTIGKRAMMEQWTSLYNSHCYDAMVRRYLLQYIFPKGANGTPDRAVIDSAVPDIEKQLGVFDRAYGDRNVLVGETVTLPDLLLAPTVFYLGLFPESKASLEKVPNLMRAHAWIAQRESFKATMPPVG
ncbi:MAG TPA: SRPBCC domain-containing protein [Casimicrobiaceae bacterium]|jgi:glutathione S-transferase